MSFKKKRRVSFRRKRSLDPNLVFDYKDIDMLKRFITERGKIIPRRISGATAMQQRSICTAVKRARYLALLPFSVAHRQERSFATEMAALAASAARYASMPRQERPASRDDDEDMGHEGNEEE